MIKDMLGRNIIQCSHHIQGQNFLVKKNGTLRLCIDYQKFIDVTKRRSVSLPRTDNASDALTGLNRFSTLDLAYVYWKIVVHPDGRRRTAFTIPSALH